MTQTARKGAHSGVQTEFTFFLNIKPGQGQAVRDAIKEVANDPRRVEAIQEVATLHEARFVLFDNDTRIMFAASFDGTFDKYIDDFAATYISHIFDAVFSHCEDWPGLQDPHARDWLQDRGEEAATFISSYPNATVKQIWKALAVEKAFQHVLDDPAAAQALQDPSLKPLLELAST